MSKFIKIFSADEDGAVTVDWVVITAGMVILGIVLVVAIRAGTHAMGSNLEDGLTAESPFTAAPSGG